MKNESRVSECPSRQRDSQRAQTHCSWAILEFRPSAICVAKLARNSISGRVRGEWRVELVNTPGCTRLNTLTWNSPLLLIGRWRRL